MVLVFRCQIKESRQSEMTRLVTRYLEQVKSIVEKMRNDCAGGIKSHLTVDVSSVIHTLTLTLSYPPYLPLLMPIYLLPSFVEGQ
jgi:hypothetical protein